MLSLIASGLTLIVTLSSALSFAAIKASFREGLTLRRAILINPQQATKAYCEQAQKPLYCVHRLYWHNAEGAWQDSCALNHPRANNFERHWLLRLECKVFIAPKAEFTWHWQTVWWR